MNYFVPLYQLDDQGTNYWLKQLKPILIFLPYRYIIQAGDNPQWLSRDQRTDHKAYHPIEGSK